MVSYSIPRRLPRVESTGVEQGRFKHSRYLYDAPNVPKTIHYSTVIAILLRYFVMGSCDFNIIIASYLIHRVAQGKSVYWIFAIQSLVDVMFLIHFCMIEDVMWMSISIAKIVVAYASICIDVYNTTE